MSIIDHFLGTLAPYDCLGCGKEGSLVCAGCASSFTQVPERCYLCYEASLGGLTCDGCSPKSQLHSVRVATLYKGLAKDLLWSLKSAGTQAAAKQMAAQILPLLPRKQQPIIVHIPTATSRVRQRGYDQAKLLARQLARQSGLPYSDVLARSGQAHQVGATRAERLTQIAGAFRVSSPKRVRQAHIILVDDVLTTGATLEAAATVLRAAGATRIDAVAFAQA